MRLIHNIRELIVYLFLNEIDKDKVVFIIKSDIIVEGYEICYN